MSQKSFEVSDLKFSKDWTDPSDFATYEPNETQVREDMQFLHNETRDFINKKLIPAIVRFAAACNGLVIRDHFSSLDELQSAIANPAPGDAYAVGETAPYDIYIYGASSKWVNCGVLSGAQGAPGEKGEDGAPGENGADGTDGHTPVRGVDYWTVSDKQEIVDQTTAAMSGHKHSPGDINTNGSFGAQVKANSANQDPSTALLRNTKLVGSDTAPSANGEINWTYK